MDGDYDGFWQARPDTAAVGPATRHTQRLIIGELRRLMPFASLCDVGCGDGSLLRRIAGVCPGVGLYGLDVSSVGVARASLPGATVAVADVTSEALPWACDVAVCSEVLEHLADDVAGLRNIAAGAERLVVTVPAGAITPNLAAIGHLRHYTRASLREALEAGGWHVERLYSWGFPVYNLYRLLLAGGGDALTRGEFGLARRLAAEVMYAALLITVPGWGPGCKLVAVARRRKSGP